jgi:hypothetical protein
MQNRFIVLALISLTIIFLSLVVKVDFNQVLADATKLTTFSTANRGFIFESPSTAPNTSINLDLNSGKPFIGLKAGGAGAQITLYSARSVGSDEYAGFLYVQNPETPINNYSVLWFLPPQLNREGKALFQQVINGGSPSFLPVFAQTPTTTSDIHQVATKEYVDNNIANNNLIQGGYVEFWRGKKVKDIGFGYYYYYTQFSSHPGWRQEDHAVIKYVTFPKVFKKTPIVTTVPNFHWLNGSAPVVFARNVTKEGFQLAIGSSGSYDLYKSTFGKVGLLGGEDIDPVTGENLAPRTTFGVRWIAVEPTD